MFYRIILFYFIFQRRELMLFSSYCLTTILVIQVQGKDKRQSVDSLQVFVRQEKRTNAIHVEKLFSAYRKPTINQ